MPLVRTLAFLSLAAVVALGSAGCKPRGAKPAADPASAPASAAADSEWKARYEQLAQEREQDKAGTVGAEASALGVSDLGEGFSSAGAGRVALGEDFAFERGSANLNSEGKKAIEKLALKLNDGDLANQLVVVEGHTDDQPVSRPHTIEMYTDNWGLSAARSASVIRALQKAGVKPERLRGAFRGQYAPAVTGKDQKGANRRVEIFLSK
jgi:flagellar motor protein MotB